MRPQNEHIIWILLDIVGYYGIGWGFRFLGSFNEVWWEFMGYWTTLRFVVGQANRRTIIWSILDRSSRQNGTGHRPLQVSFLTWTNYLTSIDHLRSNGDCWWCLPRTDTEWDIYQSTAHQAWIIVDTWLQQPSQLQTRDWKRQCLSLRFNLPRYIMETIPKQHRGVTI